MSTLYYTKIAPGDREYYAFKIPDDLTLSAGTEDYFYELCAQNFYQRTAPNSYSWPLTIRLVGINHNGKINDLPGMPERRINRTLEIHFHIEETA